MANFFDQYDAPKQDKGILTEIGEAALAIPRGVEAAVQDTYNLVDYAAGGVLPDYDQRLLGESEDAGDKIIEGISNFATAFIPISGGLSLLGKSTKVGRMLGFGAKSGFAFWGKQAVAGALTDLVAYSGQESKLSDLIQDFPALANPVTAFLASDPNDSEAEGRLKNVLEGFILGTAVDVAMAGFKGLKTLKNLPADATEEQAVEALKKAGVGNLPKEPTLPKVEVDTGDLGFKPAPPPRAAAVETTGVTKYDKSLEALGFDPRKGQELLERIKARKGQENLVNPRDFTADELVDAMLEGNALNLAHFRTSEDVGTFMRAIDDISEKFFEDGILTEPRTWDEDAARAMADAQDSLAVADPADFLAVLAQRTTDASNDFAKAAREARKIQFQMQFAARAVYDNAVKPLLEAGGEDAVKGAQLVQQISVYQSIQAAARGVRSETGRLLNFYKFDIPDLTLNPEAAKEILSGAGGADAVKEMATKLAAAFGEGGAAGTARMSKLLEPKLGRKILNAGVEYWMNAILSGPKTAVVNGMSGAMMTVYRPLELMLGSKVSQLLGQGSGAEVREAALEMAGMWQSIGEAAHWAKVAFKNGKPILNKRGIIDTPESARGAIAALGKEGHVSGHVFNALGAVVNVPGRVLQSTDEFFKQLNYRGVARRHLLQQAQAQGFNPQETAEFMVREMDKLIFEGQAFSQEALFRRGLRTAEVEGITNPAAKTLRAAEFSKKFYDEIGGDSFTSISKQALGVAEDVTFTRPLEAGSLSARYQAAVNEVPMMRFLTPFIRTPVNIAQAGLQRFDAISAIRILNAKSFSKNGLKSLEGSKTRLIQDALSGSARQRAEAMGRLTAGLGFAFTGLALATNNQLTGRGPRDAEQRQILLDDGWLPYSLKVGGKYIQYGRLEPFSVMLGLVADLSEYGKHSTSEDQSFLETALFGISVALANNLANKTYLTGVRNFLDAAQDPERNMARFFERYAASLVPNIAGQAPVDESTREVRGLLDAMMAKTPGLSDNLAPRRNILGEPVKKIRAAGSDVAGVLDWFVPLAMSDVSDDLIYNELRELKHGFTPPRHVRGGVDLVEFSKNGQDAYDRWGELQGTTTIGGKTLRQTLRQVIQSPSYQRLPIEGTLEVDSPRIARLKSIISRYQAAAFRQVLQEYPEVRERYTEVARTKSALRKGISPALL